MPAGDGTGPMGMGPMTGRAAGFCAGHDVPGYANPIPGRGFGRGFWGRGWRGGGRGWRHMYYATGLPGWMRFGYGQWPAPQMTAAWGAEPWAYGAPAPGPMPREQELQMLRDHAEALKAQLDQISAHIEELVKEA
ncbi:MAG: DUF5320 domain-containing protein [Anaerolineales bacterium]|nr:DUF5320 domain-containing protein [Anaerolineales bacterium]